MNTRKYVSAALTLAAIASVFVAIPAFAATPSTTQPPAGGWQGGMHGSGMMGGGMRGHAMGPIVIGTISSINGTTLTVSGHEGFGTSTPATAFTVNASNATVKKNNATSTVSAIAAGDTVVVQGTISGSSVTATMIRDGVMMMGRMGPGGRGMPGQNPSQNPPASPIVGNGQPVIAGTVSAISGSTLTITNKSNVTYTVDASNAKIVQGQNTIAISGVTVGDSVLVQGTVNGTSVTASSVIDQKASATGSATSGTSQASHKGFFGGIGQFFSHLFGF